VSQFIQDIKENSAQGIVCNQFYQDCLEQVLADHPWKFATRYAALQLTGTPNSDYSNLYAYPNDCLFARQLYNDTTIMSLTSNGIYIDSWDLYAILPFIPIIPFTVIEDEVNGGLLLATDLDTPTLVYTARIANPNLFTPGFASALAWKLASEIAAPLTGKLEYGKAADDAYNKAMSTAQARDLNEGHENDQRESELIIVRL
jgi:hypothetical protein